MTAARPGSAAHVTCEQGPNGSAASHADLLRSPRREGAPREAAPRRPAHQQEAAPTPARRPLAEGIPCPRGPGLARAGVALVVCGALAAVAGGRPRPGGTLQVALVGQPGPVEPLTADAPVDALRLLLTHQPLCQLVEASRPSATVLRLEALPGVEPSALAARLDAVRAGASPARALLIDVAGWSVAGRAVELQLRGAAPSLERALCHPAFALPTGPFVAKGNRLGPVLAQPLGRPWFDEVALQVTDARTAERLFAQRRVQLVVGPGGDPGAAQLFATALVLGPGVEPHLRQALDAVVDRGDLARFFVGGPAGPLPTLVPAALGETTPLRAPPRPPPVSPARDVVLTYADDAEHERAIAQRLQVKLQPLGYRLALKSLPRASLRGRQPAERELQLVSLLLPPTAVGALLVWADVAGVPARGAALLQQLGGAADAEARARELAPAFGQELPLVPLVTRGLGLLVAPEVQRLSRDALGLPRLDDAFLAPE